MLFGVMIYDLTPHTSLKMLLLNDFIRDKIACQVVTEKGETTDVNT